LVKDSASATGDVNIAEIQGTTGSAPAIDRQTGFKTAIAANPKLKIIATQTGDFTRAGGKQVMEAFLKAHPKGINVVFAHNDDMALGAIEAIEAAGLTPGKDIKIVSIDAVKDGMTALSEGKINYIVECNPLLGPQLMETAKQVVAGDTVPTRIETKETVFDQAAATAALPTRQY
jgi:simple sugar transport system substrate-binding protein